MIGETVVDLDVDTTGRTVPGSFTVIETDHEFFARSVENALNGWRWVPARRDGQLVVERQRYRFRFRLRRDSTEACPDSYVSDFVVCRLTVRNGRRVDRFWTTHLRGRPFRTI